MELGITVNIGEVAYEANIDEIVLFLDVINDRINTLEKPNCYDIYNALTYYDIYNSLTIEAKDLIKGIYNYIEDEEN